MEPQTFFYVSKAGVRTRLSILAFQSRIPVFLLCTVVFFFALSGCKKQDHLLRNDFEQVNLVSDVSGFGAPIIDPNLVNAWGMAVAPSGPIWVSANGTGVSTVYNKDGGTVRPPVIIPTPESPSGGKPSGQVFNNTSDFAIHFGKTTQPSRFIFATEDGTIAAWGGGDTARIMADQSSAEAVYKGLALASDGGQNFLYATNFKQARIDVFDMNYNLVSGKPFSDPSIPAGFAPFNIRLIGGLLYVTYAKQKLPDKEDDQAGPGNGFVDIFKTDGSLVRRFASRGTLNSPWGLVQVQGSFCRETASAILVGNFGDGRINIFDEQGHFFGQLKDEHRAITIDGLWALEYSVPNAPGRLYFTAGPGGENHGLFGYLTRGD